MTAAIMDNLLKLLDAKGEISKRIVPHADGFVVAHGLYIVLIEMALLCDEQKKADGNARLDSYRINSPFWDVFKQIRVTNMRFYDPTLAKDLHWISRHLRKPDEGSKDQFFDDSIQLGSGSSASNLQGLLRC